MSLADPPWPYAALTKKVFWGNLAVLVLLALGINQHHFRQQQLALAESATAQQAAHTQRWAELVALSKEAAALSMTADTSTLERQILSSVPPVLAGPEPPEQRALRADFHLTQARLAFHRSDLPVSVSQLATATALSPTPAQRTEEDLLRVEIFLSAQQFNLARTAADALEVSLTTPANRLHLGILQARIATAAAAASTRQDQWQREQNIAQLKAKGLTLSAQLRSELSAEFTAQSEAQQQASAQNDPTQMAAALKSKEAYDEKFSAELKRREAQLTEEAAAALQPDATVSERQASAVAAWQALAHAELPPAETMQVTLGLAEALLQQQDFSAATTALGPTLTSQASNLLDQATAHHLSARLSQAQAIRSAGPSAAAALQQALNSAQQAFNLLSKVSQHRPAILEQRSTIETTLAAIHTALKQPEPAETLTAQAEQHRQMAHADHGWREIFWNLQTQTNQLRQALRQNYRPETLAPLAQIQALQTALEQWQAATLQQLSTADAEAKVNALIQSAPAKYLWSSLLGSIR